MRDLFSRMRPSQSGMPLIDMHAPAVSDMHRLGARPTAHAYS